MSCVIIVRGKKGRTGLSPFFSVLNSSTFSTIFTILKGFECCLLRVRKRSCAFGQRARLIVMSLHEAHEKCAF